MKFSIITPCFNAEKYIEETILSVLQQTAIIQHKATLEYIICDGGSQDNTVAIAKKIQNNSPQGQAIQILSEPDGGMYDALAKGMKQISGDVVAYINAGDYYHQCAFDVVLDIFTSQPVISWLTGYNVAYNEKSQVVYVRLPYHYRQELFACGYYGPKLPSLQQESTFWRAELNQLLDYKILSQFKYAGDFYLWLKFSQKYQLKIVESYLGGFRNHSGQLSENKQAYYGELATLVHPPRVQDRILAFFDRILWSAPTQIKKKFNPEGILRFNHQKQTWG